MTGYRIGPARFRNFGPFVDVSFDLSKPGLTCIEGDYIGHGCDSNGSGKSYVIDGVSWVLFDRTLRERVSKDAVIRLMFEQKRGRLEVIRDTNGDPVRPTDGCYGEVHLVGGPQPAKVVRYRGHPTRGNRVELYVNKKNVTQGRDSMTQASIENLIGMDFRAFGNSTAFGAGDDARSFFSATDSERKSIMDRILGFEVYASAERVTRIRHREKCAEVSVEEFHVGTTQERLATEEKSLAQVMSDEELVDREWQLTRASLEKRCAVNHRPRLERALDVATERWRKAERAFERNERKYDERLAQHKRAESKLTKRVRRADREVADVNADIRVLAKEREHWNGLADQTCPTCQQLVRKSFAKKMRVAVAAKCNTCFERLSTFQNQAEELHGALKELEPPHAPDDSRVVGAKAKHRIAEAALEEHDRKISAAKRREHELERDLSASRGKADTIAQTIKQTRKELNVHADRAKKAQAEADSLAFWVKGFGNGGIKSFLMENELPEINRIASRYAQRLLGRGSRVKLSSTRTLKSGGEREELSVDATIPGCTIAYANASKGQKRRLDLCLLLAMRDTVSSRNAKSFHQFFADELFDGLDETGEDYVVELLRELSAECPVILVTHSPRLKSIGDRIIRVRHENGVSTVETT